MRLNPSGHLLLTPGAPRAGKTQLSSSGELSLGENGGSVVPKPYTSSRKGVVFSPQVSGLWAPLTSLKQPFVTAGYKNVLEVGPEFLMGNTRKSFCEES